MFSKQTEKLGLPQWIGTDHPDFLTDINDAFKKIDENAAGVATEIDGLPDRVKQLADTVTNQQASIATIEGDVASDKIAISNLQTAVAPVEGQGQQIEALGTRIDTAEQKISNVEQDITELQTGIGSTDSNVEQLAGNISDLQSFQTSQESKNTDIEKDISDLQTSVGNNQTAIESLESFQDAVNSANLLSKVSNGSGIVTMTAIDDSTDTISVGLNIIQDKYLRIILSVDSKIPTNGKTYSIDIATIPNFSRYLNKLAAGYALSSYQIFNESGQLLSIGTVGVNKNNITVQCFTTTAAGPIARNLYGVSLVDVNNDQ